MEKKIEIRNKKSSSPSLTLKNIAIAYWPYGEHISCRIN